jgi:hypothetical protein
MTEPVAAPGPQPAGPPNARWALTQIEEALRGLRFGTVTIVVQDGVVIQVERTEKWRLQRSGKKSE